MDRRVAYLVQKYPKMQIQLIPLAEDSSEINRYNSGDSGAKKILEYAQARFSAYPNVQWCLSNDRNMGTASFKSGIQKAAADMKARERWGSLITNHQIRGSGYAFPNESWSDIVTLEDKDQVHGAKILEYRKLSTDPVINDEDRYESYLPPANPRYFFRRLMWASLFSGGSATYAGLQSWEAYDGQKKRRSWLLRYSFKWPTEGRGC